MPLVAGGGALRKGSTMLSAHSMGASSARTARAMPAGRPAQPSRSTSAASRCSGVARPSAASRAASAAVGSAQLALPSPLRVANASHAAGSAARPGGGASSFALAGSTAEGLRRGIHSSRTGPSMTNASALRADAGATSGGGLVRGVSGAGAAAVVAAQADDASASNGRSNLPAKLVFWSTFTFGS